MHLERNPVGVSHGWGNENAPTSTPSTLGIPGGATRRFTKQATTLPTEGNTPISGTKSQALNMVLMRGSPMLHNTVGGGNGIVGGTGTTAAPAAGQHQGAGRRSTGGSVLTEAVKMFGPSAITHYFLEKLLT